MTCTPEQLRDLAGQDHLRHTHGDVWEALLDAADALEAHQATQADRAQLRWHMANIVAQCGRRHRSCQRCEFAFTSGREALGKDAARAGQEASE